MHGILNQCFHSTWKTFKNDSTPRKAGKILEFCDFQ